MRMKTVNFLLTLLLVIAGRGIAQEASEMPMPKPEKEHQLLQRFVGEWVTESEGSMGPEQPTMHCSGTLECRALGGFWVLNEMKGDMQGTPIHGIQTIGYDATQKKYVGTWVDSMTSFMWQYQGSVDASGKVLTLGAKGPNFMAEGKETKFEDIYEFKSANEIEMTSRMMTEDGTWVTFMSGTAKRKK